MTEEELNEKLYNLDDSLLGKLPTLPSITLDSFFVDYYSKEFKDFKKVWEQYKPVHPKDNYDPEPPKKESRWFVVHDDAYDTYVTEHHTKKEALKEMKGCLSSCWLIKGKIVK